MLFGAIALTALGLITGLLFGFKVLVPVVGLVLVASVAFSVYSQLSFFEAALTTLVSQIVLQGSYFVGVTISVLLSNTRGGRHVL